MNYVLNFLKKEKPQDPLEPLYHLLEKNRLNNENNSEKERSEWLPEQIVSESGEEKEEKSEKKIENNTHPDCWKDIEETFLKNNKKSKKDQTALVSDLTPAVNMKKEDQNTNLEFNLLLQKMRKKNNSDKNNHNAIKESIKKYKI
jgi:hypothetical protein